MYNLLDNMEPEEIDVHKSCGSPELEERRWVNINTGKVEGSDDSGDVYCNKCEKIVYSDEIISMAEYDEKN